MILQMAEDGLCARSVLHQLADPIDSVHTAKATAKRTANAGMMCGGSFSEERGSQIFLHWHAMKRVPRERIRAFHEPFWIVSMQPEHVLVGEPLNAFEPTISPECINQLEQRLFSLAAHHIIDIFCIQRRI